MSRQKRRFPWKRLAAGAYFSLAAILGLLRTFSGKHLTNPYLKPAAMIIFVAGAALLAWGIWAMADWKNSN